MPDYKKKFKTKVFKDSNSPVWNEKFVFEKLKLEDLRSNRVVELTVWDLLKNTKHYDFIGGLRLGPPPQHEKLLHFMDSNDTELSHYMSVIDTPGQCVERTHRLRDHMDPRPVTVVTSKPSYNQTTASKEVVTSDVNVTMTTETVTIPYSAVTTSQVPTEPQHQSMPITTTLMSQPSIAISEDTPITTTLISQPSITISEDTPIVVSPSHHSDERSSTSPMRSEKVKFGDDNGDDNEGYDDDDMRTPSHKVIPHCIT